MQIQDLVCIVPGGPYTPSLEFSVFLHCIFEWRCRLTALPLPICHPNLDSDMHCAAL